MSLVNENELQRLKQDFLDFEKDALGMNQELLLKRRQVDQLRRDLDGEKIKNHDLSRALDSQKHRIEETGKNLNLALQNNQLLDGKLQEKIEETTKLKLQCDLLVNESKTLRELLHKSELEKFDLLHKVEDLEEQNKRQRAFHKHINNTDQKMMDFINEIKREITEVELKTKNLSDVAKELKLSKQLYEQTVFLRNKMKDLQAEKEMAEKQIIGINTKYDKLKQLLDDHKFLVPLSVETLQIQFKESVENHKSEIEVLKNCINVLAEKLSLEKEANDILISQDVNNAKLIDDLRAVLNRKADVKDAEIQADDGSVEIKQEQKEVIEID